MQRVFYSVVKNSYHYKVPVTLKDFAIVLDAIPSGVALSFRNVSRPGPQPTFH